MTGWIIRWTVAIVLFAGALGLCFAVGWTWLAITIGALALLITILAMLPAGAPVGYPDDDQPPDEA